jgi:hypothetical protein
MSHTNLFKQSTGQDILAKPVSRGESSASGNFKNLTFAGEYWKSVIKFTKPTTRLRFLPPIDPSKYDWILKLDVYKDKAGVTFVSPTTFDQQAVDPFKKAQFWLRKNRPELLSNRDTNPDGLKLYPSPVGVAWAIDLDPEEGGLKIFQASLYDGSRGGSTGLAATIYKQANEIDQEPGSSTLGQKINGDITDYETGKAVKVERSKSEKAEYASYTTSIGRVPVPLGPVLENLRDEEINLLKPLEDVVYIPSTEEIHGILKGYIGEELHHEIFTAQ